MPDQRQIFAGAVTAAPDDYMINAGVEFTLVAVNADFTDNGAATDWLPAVELVSDSGHVIARAVDQGVKVTAGSDAEVSWFPGVKHAAAGAAASGAQWFYATHVSNLSANGLTTVNVPWTATQTSDSSVFTLTNDHGANTTITVNKPGMTLMSVAAAQVGVVDVPGALFCSSAADRAFGSYGNNALTDYTTKLLGTGNSDVPRDYRLSVGTTSPFDLFVRYQNNDGSARSLNNIVVGVFWWPNSTLIV